MKVCEKCSSMLPGQRCWPKQTGRRRSVMCYEREPFSLKYTDAARVGGFCVRLRIELSKKARLPDRSKKWSASTCSEQKVGYDYALFL